MPLSQKTSPHARQWCLLKHRERLRTGGAEGSCDLEPNPRDVTAARAQQRLESAGCAVAAVEVWRGRSGRTSIATHRRSVPPSLPVSAPPPRAAAADDRYFLYVAAANVAAVRPGCRGCRRGTPEAESCGERNITAAAAAAAALCAASAPPSAALCAATAAVVAARAAVAYE